jgi:hypothetical protein
MFLFYPSPQLALFLRSHLKHDSCDTFSVLLPPIFIKNVKNALNSPTSMLTGNRRMK